MGDPMMLTKSGVGVELVKRQKIYSVLTSPPVKTSVMSTWPTTLVENKVEFIDWHCWLLFGTNQAFQKVTVKLNSSSTVKVGVKLAGPGLWQRC